MGHLQRVQWSPVLSALTGDPEQSEWFESNQRVWSRVWRLPFLLSWQPGSWKLTITWPRCLWWKPNCSSSRHGSPYRSSASPTTWSGNSEVCVPFTFPSAIDGFLEAYSVLRMSSSSCFSMFPFHKGPQYSGCPGESSIPSAQWVNLSWNSDTCREGNVEIFIRKFCSFRPTTCAKPKGESQLLSLYHLRPSFMSFLSLLCVSRFAPCVAL